MDTTVAVVGAGLSGLIAARELHRRGIDVLVLEAADRVGGRALSETTALGSRVDLGGQWIGHDHHRLMALADELGATRYLMETGPLPTVVSGTRKVRAAIPAAALALLAAEGLSRSPRSSNTTTVADVLRRIPLGTPRRLLEVVAAISWTADLDRLSIRAAATMIRIQHGLKTMLSTRGGAQDSLIVDGAGTLAERVAADLGPRVHTGRRVTAIVDDGSGVVLRTDTGNVRAARVIVTVPAPLLPRITFDPPVPDSRIALSRNTYMGSVYKAIAVYERPFWRDRHRGEFIVLDHPGRAVFDTSPPGGPGHLCVLVGGPEAHELDHLETGARRRAVLNALTPFLGAEILAPASWHEKSWHLDEDAGGGYMALPAPGTTEGLWPFPHDAVGRLHWAGTETATDHPGYLDGAIESGLRAAGEAAAILVP